MNKIYILSLHYSVCDDKFEESVVFSSLDKLKDFMNNKDAIENLGKDGDMYWDCDYARIFSQEADNTESRTLLSCYEYTSKNEWQKLD